MPVEVELEMVGGKERIKLPVEIWQEVTLGHLKPQQLCLLNQ
jgi:hypothetical protein